MDFDLGMLEGSLHPKNIFEVCKYEGKFAKDNPDYFYPQELLVFCGSQGSGKTFLDVQHIRKLCIEYLIVLLVEVVF